MMLHSSTMMNCSEVNPNKENTNTTLNNATINQDELEKLKQEYDTSSKKVFNKNTPCAVEIGPNFA